MLAISRFLILSFFPFSLALAQNINACPGGTYAVVHSPDGGTLSILFDSFIVRGGGNGGLNEKTKSCHLSIPLGLPEGYSIGVYKVDYRGFASLGPRQIVELAVDYFLGPHNNGRNFRRTIRGAHVGDYIFSETLGAGAMKRVGCGEAAQLDVSITLDLQIRGQAEEALATLDSADGAPHGGLIYHLDYKKCRD